jgi:hypothetical protein
MSSDRIFRDHGARELRKRKRRLIDAVYFVLRRAIKRSISQFPDDQQDQFITQAREQGGFSGLDPALPLELLRAHRAPRETNTNLPPVVPGHERRSDRARHCRTQTEPRSGIGAQPAAQEIVTTAPTIRRLAGRGSSHQDLAACSLGPDDVASPTTIRRECWSS